MAAAGEKHCVCLDNDGLVWSFGCNDEGQLGRTSDLVIPRVIDIKKTFVSVSCGLVFTAAVDSEGDVHAFGNNTYGQLGIVNQAKTILKHEKYFQNIPVRSVHCGYTHTLCITGDECLWGFGANEDGQLGLKHNVTQFSPKKIVLPDSVSSVACGGSHSIVKLASGDVLATGNNRSGQLGFGDLDNRNEFTKLKFLGKEINCDLEIASISCGSAHTIILTVDGEVYGTGQNVSGQLGKSGFYALFTTVFVAILFDEPIREISCGYIHTAFIGLENSLYVSGNLALGMGNTQRGRSPVRHSLIDEVLTISQGGFVMIVKTTKGTFGVSLENPNEVLGSGIPNSTSSSSIISFHEEYQHIVAATRKYQAKSARK